MSALPRGGSVGDKSIIIRTDGLKGKETLVVYVSSVH
jgi:hypothetical protein